MVLWFPKIMLNLLVFAACEKVIVSTDGTASLIALLENINIEGLPEEKLVDNAAFPFSWSSMAMWERNIEVDEPISFDAKVEVSDPNGKVGMISQISFSVHNGERIFRVIFNFPVFPIGIHGLYSATLFYKQSDLDEWNKSAEYSIKLNHKTLEINEEQNKEVTPK